MHQIPHATRTILRSVAVLAVGAGVWSLAAGAGGREQKIAIAAREIESAAHEECALAGLAGEGRLTRDFHATEARLLDEKITDASGRVRKQDPDGHALKKALAERRCAGGERPR